MFELRPHQEVAVKKMHNGCILCGGVGVGKTHTAIAYYLANEAPKPVYVITTAKKRDKGDWQTVFGSVGMHKDPKLTMGAVVIVDSWENIKKYQEVKDGFFIFDEQRLVGTGQWVKAFYSIAQHNRWVMLSATPGDNWLDYVPVFRANGFVKNITAFKEDHVVSRWTGRYYQVIGYRQVPKLVRWRNQLLVDMPYEKHTTRVNHDVLCTYDTALVKELVTKRWHVFEKRPLTDASELFRVMRRVVYSDASRIAAVQKLVQSHPKLIVFYNFDFELEMLRQLGQTVEVESSTNPQPPTALSSADTSTTKSPRTIGTERSASTKLDETLDTSNSRMETPTCQSGQNQNPRDTSKTEQNQQPKKLLSSGERTGGSPSTSERLSEKQWATQQARLTGSESKLSESETCSTALATSRSSSTHGLGCKECLQNQGAWTEDHGDGEIYIPARTVSPCTHSQIQQDQQPNESLIRTESERNGSTRRSQLKGPSTSPTPAFQCSPNCPGCLDSNSSPPELLSTTDLKPLIESGESTRKSTGSSKIPESVYTLGQSGDTLSNPTHTSVSVAEWNGHKHQEIPKTDSWVYLVQYVAGSEAWECIETDAICFYSMPYSYKLWWQAHGRIDRLNTSFLELHYYTLFADSVLERSVRASLTMKKSFNESAFMEKFTEMWENW